MVLPVICVAKLSRVTSTSGNSGILVMLWFSLDYYGVMRLLKSFLHILFFWAVFGTGVRAAPQNAAPPATSVLNAQLFYQLLLAEISATNQDTATAYALTLDAARKAKSEQLYERTVNIALQARSGDSALEASQAWSKAFPNSQNANRYVLQILIGLERIDESLEPLKRSVALVHLKDRAAIISLIPRYYARTQDKALAARLAYTALTRELGTQGAIGAAAWTAVGILRLNADDKDGALEAATQGLKQDVTSEGVGLLAVQLMQPDLPQAEAIVQNVLEQAPTSELRMAFARKLLEFKRYSETYAQMQALNQEKPDFADAWLIRASIELQDNNFAAAVGSLKAYVALEDKSTPASATPQDMGRGLVQAYLLLSQIAAQNQLFDDADAYLQRIQSPPEYMQIQARRAMLLAQQGRIADARKLVRDIPETQPTDARNKVSMELQILRDLKEHQAAYDFLKDATQRYPQDVDLLYDLAIMCDKLHKMTEMERILRHVMVLQPTYHHAYNALGFSFAERNIRLQEARLLVAKALELAPKDAHVLDSMGWVEFRLGKLDEALRLLEQAYQAMPDAEIAAHLGEVLWIKGDRDQAGAIWDKGLELNRDNATLKETLQRLRSPQ